MLVAAILLQLTAGYATAATIAPRRPQPGAYQKRPSRTSRVRRWTIDQRVCDRRTEGKCVTAAPDVVQAEADKPRD